MWILGSDVPYELVEAFGYHPIRLVPDGGVDQAAIGALVGVETLSARGRALLAAICALPPEDALLISHADAEQPQLFATLRELARTGAAGVPNVRFLDLLTLDRAATRHYNRLRLDQAIAWLTALGGTADRRSFAAAIVAGNVHRAELRRVLELRRERRLSGAAAHAIIASAAVLPRSEHLALLRAFSVDEDAAPFAMPAIVLSGSDLETPALVARIERLGGLVIAEDHGWGEDRADRDLAGDDPLEALAGATLDPRSGPFSSAADRGARLAAKVALFKPQRLLHLSGETDESAPWEVAALKQALAGSNVPLLVASTAISDRDLAAFITAGHVPTPPIATAPEVPAAPRAKPPRSRKSLAAVARFGVYQREWFAGIRQSVSDGTPFAVVNANAPQEILRAFGVPFVVNQWWASIVAAKQQSDRYAALLTDADLPRSVEAYSAQGVAAALDRDAELAPWGGLPLPQFLGAVLSTDATPRIYEQWAMLTGAQFQRYERSIESRWEVPVDWWDGLPDRWDELLEPERLDLFEADLRRAIAELEKATGRSFDAARFEAVMDLVNEQEDYYRQTRDLIARSVPAPVSIVDTMPATMVPQWHRGTQWARDAARDFYLEVKSRADAGEAACPDERIRLMFVGRGLWGDMSFYQRWEESHGAVFVWSMYLALAADGYIRRYDRDRDPLRALAARFVTMGDELRMPTWAGEWHVKEAKLHGIDGAVALSDADPLVLRALRRAGIAVLELGMDNFVRDPAAEADVDRRVADFLEGPAAAASAARRN